MNAVTWVIWHITQHCNLACDYCFTDSSPHSPRPSSAEALRHTAGAINASGAGLVTIIGGEPFTVRELPGHVERLLEVSDRKVNIDTNGMFLKARWSDVYSRVNRINVSLDGATTAVHDSVRGGYHGVLAGIKLLGEKEVPFGTNITVTPNNHAELADTAKLALDLGASVIGFGRAKPIGRGAGYLRDNPLTMDQENVAVQGIRDFHARYGDQCTVQVSGFFAPDLFESGAANKLPSCMCGHGKLTIHHDGDIYPCEVMPFLQDKSAWEERFGTVPNILNNSLASALDGSLFSAWRDFTGSQPAECRSCRYRLYCNTGCAALSFVESGRRRKDVSCRI